MLIRGDETMHVFPRLLYVSRRMPLMAISVLACFFVAMASATSFGLENVLPPQIKDLKMGSSSSQVIDKIGSAGTHSEEVSPKDHRMKLTWLVPDNPYYQKLVFGFTGKDRLYQIRFLLRPELRRELQPIKKAFLEKFRISSEDPGKLRIKGQDVLMYLPEKGGDDTFFEFTNIETGEKWFELFYREISFQDRQTKPKDDKKENKGDSDKK
jgi:hypothetical protein